MAVESSGSELIAAVALLGSAVVAVPIFKRIGLGSVVGYLVAGVVIGPFGLKLFRDPDSILASPSSASCSCFSSSGWN